MGLGGLLIWRLSRTLGQCLSRNLFALVEEWRDYRIGDDIISIRKLPFDSGRSRLAGGTDGLSNVRTLDSVSRRHPPLLFEANLWSSRNRIATVDDLASAHRALALLSSSRPAPGSDSFFAALLRDEMLGGSRVIILRYSDYETDTLESHIATLADGPVLWGGWWKKQHEGFPHDLLERAARSAAEREVRVGLVHRVDEKFAVGICSEVVYRGGTEKSSRRRTRVELRSTTETSAVLHGSISRT